MLDFTTQRPQWMMLVGIVLLGWILMRRQLKSRKRSRAEARQHRRAMKKLAHQETPGVPLAGAPVETLRWQAELFDLQRELKAELETKIAVVQSLLRQADQRIERLQAHAAREPLTPQQRQQAQELASAGFTVTDIAERLALPQGEVEWALTLGAVRRSEA